MNNSIEMIILLIKNFFAKIKHLQNMKISSKFEGKSEFPHYINVKNYGITIVINMAIQNYFDRLRLTVCKAIVKELLLYSTIAQFPNPIFFSKSPD